MVQGQDHPQKRSSQHKILKWTFQPFHFPFHSRIQIKSYFVKENNARRVHLFKKKGKKYSYAYHIFNSFQSNFHLNRLPFVISSNSHLHFNYHVQIFLTRTLGGKEKVSIVKYITSLCQQSVCSRKPLTIPWQHNVMTQSFQNKIKTQSVKMMNRV